MHFRILVTRCSMVCGAGGGRVFKLMVIINDFFNYRLKMLFVCLPKYEDDSVVEAEKGNTRARKAYKGRGMLSESTLSTSSSVCQFHCSELETLAARPPSPSPPSPLSTLLR